MKARRVRFDIRRQGAPILIGLLVVLVLNVASWAVLVRPKVVEFADRNAAGGGAAQKTLAEYRDSILAAEAYVQGLEQNDRDWRYLRTEVLSTREQRLVEVQQELARLCALFRIDIETVQVKNAILREDGLDRFAMVVPLQGGYDSLRNFLQAVEASEKFIVVEQVSLAGALRGGSQDLQLSITLASYFDVTPERAAPRAGGGDA